MHPSCQTLDAANTLLQVDDQRVPCRRAVRAARAKVAAARWSACRRPQQTCSTECTPHATAGAGGPSYGGPRTAGALASRTTQKESRPSPLGRSKVLCGLGIAKRISTRSACFPPSRSCTLRACKSPHCSVQVSAKRCCNPRQVAPVAKGRRLTLPSRGCPKGCAFCAPLMSNVRHPRAPNEH